MKDISVNELNLCNDLTSFIYQNNNMEAYINFDHCSEYRVRYN